MKKWIFIVLVVGIECVYGQVDYSSPMDDMKKTSDFGERNDVKLGVGGEYNFHLGVDYSAPRNSPVKAMADGLVVCHYPPPDGYWKGHPIYGGMVVIYHGYGQYTLYGHMKRTFVSEKAPGNIVKRGQVIGTMGSTGISTGPHLHVGMFIDPQYKLMEFEQKKEYYVKRGW